LTVQNKYACTATGIADIKTFSGGKVNIPNGFTPNNDGRDDVFYILGSEDVKLIKDFSIFNRWGQKVFQVTNAEANDPKFGWSGFLNGKPADTGTYVYIVSIAFTDGTSQLFKGTVTLIR
jgi:gliding motility-associated-like protein